MVNKNKKELSLNKDVQFMSAANVYDNEEVSEKTSENVQRILNNNIEALKNLVK